MFFMKLKVWFNVIVVQALFHEICLVYCVFLMFGNKIQQQSKLTVINSVHSVGLRRS